MPWGLCHLALRSCLDQSSVKKAVFGGLWWLLSDAERLTKLGVDNGVLLILLKNYGWSTSIHLWRGQGDWVNVDLGAACLADGSQKIVICWQWRWLVRDCHWVIALVQLATGEDTRLEDRSWSKRVTLLDFFGRLLLWENLLGVVKLFEHLIIHHFFVFSNLFLQNCIFTHRCVKLA